VRSEWRVVGREARIAADMGRYSCAVTARYLRRSLSEADIFGEGVLRTDRMLIGEGW